MKRRSMKSAWVLMLLAGFLFSGCSAGIVGAGTTTSSGGATDPTSIPSISGVVRYVSSTCSGLTVAPAQQCATVAAVDDSSYSITWGNVHSGLLNVSGQTVSMDSPTFTLGPSDTASFESAVLSWTDELLAKEAVEDGDQVTFALSQEGESCSLVMEVDSDCSDVLSIRPAITMRANLSTIMAAFLESSVAVMPSISDTDIDDTHDVCLDIEDEMTWVEGDDGSLELRVVYEISAPLHDTEYLHITTVLYFDARNHQLSRMDDLHVETGEQTFDMQCTPQEGLLSGLADEQITVMCAGEFLLDEEEGPIEVSGTMVWEQEAYSCAETYPSPEEYFEAEMYGRLGGPFPEGWDDVAYNDAKYEYYESYGIPDQDNMYYSEFFEEDFADERGMTFCIPEDQPPDVEGEEEEHLRSSVVAGMGYATIPEFISFTVRESDVCVYDENGEKIFTDACIDFVVVPEVVPMYTMQTELAGTFAAVGITGENTCLLVIDGGANTLLKIYCDNNDDDAEDATDKARASNCVLHYKRGYDRSDL